MDEHHSGYPSVTVSMDVTVVVTIHDHPWMDTTVHPPLSLCPWLSNVNIVLYKQEFRYTDSNAMVKVYGTTGYG